MFDGEGGAGTRRRPSARKQLWPTEAERDLGAQAEEHKPHGRAAERSPPSASPAAPSPLHTGTPAAGARGGRVPRAGGAVRIPGTLPGCGLMGEGAGVTVPEPLRVTGPSSPRQCQRAVGCSAERHHPGPRPPGGTCPLSRRQACRPGAVSAAPLSPGLRCSPPGPGDSRGPTALLLGKLRALGGGGARQRPRSVQLHVGKIHVTRNVQCSEFASSVFCSHHLCQVPGASVTAEGNPRPACVRSGACAHAGWLPPAGPAWPHPAPHPRGPRPGTSTSAPTPASLPAVQARH